MPDYDVYNLGEIEKLAVNLFHGWGYNFYRLENQLRADDQTIRARVGWLLGLARASVERAESEYRRANLREPTRENPRPDPMAVEQARKLEGWSRDIGALEAQIRAQPVPENDRMTQRYRQEAATLQRLTAVDAQLTGRAELLRALLDGQGGEAMIGRGAEIGAGLEAIAASLRERQSALMI